MFVIHCKVYFDCPNSVFPYWKKSKSPKLVEIFFYTRSTLNKSDITSTITKIHASNLRVNTNMKHSKAKHRR